MTRITVYDSYLDKMFSFFVDQEYNSVEEVEEELKIYNYLFFPVATIRPANRLEQLLIPYFCANTNKVEDALFCNYKYLIINRD